MVERQHHDLLLVQYSRAKSSTHSMDMVSITITINDI